MQTILASMALAVAFAGSGSIALPPHHEVAAIEPSPAEILDAAIAANAERVREKTLAKVLAALGEPQLTLAASIEQLDARTDTLLENAVAAKVAAALATLSLEPVALESSAAPEAGVLRF